MRFADLRFFFVSRDSTRNRTFRTLSDSVVASLLVCVGACGTDPMPPGDPDAGNGLPPGVVAVRTVAADFVFSGQEVLIRCELLNEEGNVVAWPRSVESTLVMGTPDTIVQASDGSYVGGKVGTTTVACSVAGLIDDTPESIEVKPGAPATVITVVSRDTVVADPTDVGTDISCEVYDAAGNMLSNEDATIELGNPFAGTLAGANAHFTLASTQTVGCIVPGAVTTWADVVVQPGKPAVIYLDLMPPQAIYRPGTTITAAVLVHDAYGNVADSTGLVVSSSPAATVHAAGTLDFKYDTAGTYTIEARIDTGTATGLPLVATAQVLVNDGAPSIDCTPQMRLIDNTIETWSALHVSGNISDQNGIKSVTINGAAVALDGSGNYAATVDPSFGANCYLVEATDNQDQIEQRCCPFIASELYSPEIANPTPANPGPGSISLAISQLGLDDYQTDNQSTPARSIGDIIDRGITQTGLANYLHTYFTRANNPGGQNHIGNTNITIDLGIFGNLTVPASVWYEPNITNGRIAVVNPNLNENLISNGLRVTVTATSFALGLHVELICSGTLCNLANDVIASLSTGVVTMNNLTSLSDLNIAEANGKFLATLVPGSITLSYSSMTSPNWVIQLAATLLPNVMKQAITDVLANVITPLAQDLLGSVTIDTFGIAVSLPKLDGSGDVTVAVSGSFTDAGANANALYAVIAPYFVVTGGTAHALPSLGVASQSPTIAPLDVAASGLLAGKSLAMSLDDTAVNDLVHRLWRAGYFDGTLDPNVLTTFGIDLGPLTSLLSGFNLAMSAPLPPVAEIRPDGKLRIGLAGTRISLTIPGASDPTPLEFELTAVFDGTIAIVDGRITLPSIARVMLDLRAMSVPQGVDPNVINALVTVAGSLIDKIMSDVLARSLVAIPIPNLKFPQNVGPITLPGPINLAIASPVLNIHGTYPYKYLVIGGTILEQP